MEIQTLSTDSDFFDRLFTKDDDAELDESTYYFLIDSSSFSGAEAFSKEYPFEGGTVLNLYADFSENLQENGALLYALTHEECIKNIEQIKNIKNRGHFNVFNSFFEIAEIQRHLEDLMEIKQPNGQSALFRFQDNFAFHATMSALNELKWKRILSFKINYWIWQSIENTFHRLDNTLENRLELGTLSFSEKEFEAINLNLKPMRLMPLLTEYDENLKDLHFYQIHDIAVKLLKKAKEQQLVSFEDEILFSTLYHQFGEFMLIEGPFKAALMQVKNSTKSFQKATDDIDLEALDHWAEKFQKTQLSTNLTKG